MAQRRLVVAASSLLLAACGVLPSGIEARSVDGVRLLASPAPAPEQRDQLEADLAAARAAFAAAPGDPDKAIWVARRLGYLGRFREAIDVLGRALDDHPDNPFLLRHRGHRWITVREFGRAATDLERAAHLCRTMPDAIEPDGQPTPDRPPHSTLHYNVHYHLGLAYFLLGDFEMAERTWLRCLAICGNDESRVAVTHWLWSARMRLRDVAGAAALVAPIHAGMDVVENTAYLDLCLLYAGKKGREDLVGRGGSSGAALRFGLAHHRLVTGDRVIAERELWQLGKADGWSAFGVIAAEVEAARLGL